MTNYYTPITYYFNILNWYLLNKLIKQLGLRYVGIITLNTSLEDTDKLIFLGI